MILFMNINRHWQNESRNKYWIAIFFLFAFFFFHFQLMLERMSIFPKSTRMRSRFRVRDLRKRHSAFCKRFCFCLKFEYGWISSAFVKLRNIQTQMRGLSLSTSLWKNLNCRHWHINVVCKWHAYPHTHTNTQAQTKTKTHRHAYNPPLPTNNFS